MPQVAELLCLGAGARGRVGSGFTFTEVTVHEPYAAALTADTHELRDYAGTL